MKVTADGGEIWLSDLKTFTSECGEASAGISFAQIDSIGSYIIDGSTPTFVI